MFEDDRRKAQAGVGALVLAAGLGTRLRPLTLVRAKPAIPVAGDPLIRRIVRSLSYCGIAEVVVNLHHLPQTVAGVLGDGADLGVSVRYSWEQPAVLGSAGGPRQALDIIGTETFLIVNGDTLTDVDIPALLAAHERSGAQVTLAVTPNQEPLRYGGVLLDDQVRVVGFTPRGPHAAGSFHFVGVQVAEADVFRHLQPGQARNSIGDVYNHLITGRTGAVCGFVSAPTFWDIGTVGDYIATSRAFASAEPAANGSVHVDRTACVRDSILWSNIDVGPGAIIESCIVTDNLSIPPGAIYRGAILRRDAAGAIIASPLEATDD